MVLFLRDDWKNKLHIDKPKTIQELNNELNFCINDPYASAAGNIWPIEERCSGRGSGVHLMVAKLHI